VHALHPKTAQEVVALAERAEALGYSSVLVQDHVENQAFGSFAAMAFMAAATSKIHIGSLMLCNDFRHPLLLARELTTIAQAAPGRLEVGIGAGWMRSDYDILGIPMDRGGIRVRRLGEAVRVLKRSFADPVVDLAGEHYAIAAHDNSFRIDGRRPTIILGGGAPRMLSLAAREADIVAVNPSVPEGSIGPAMGAYMNRAATIEKIGIVRAAAGERYDEVEICNLVNMVAITANADAAARAIGDVVGLGPEEIPRAEICLVGSVGEVVDELEQRRDQLDMSYIVVPDEVLDAFVPVMEALQGS
jgi:probable F420-dependent oxidoreductase